MKIRKHIPLLLAGFFAVPIIAAGAIMRAEPQPDANNANQDKKVIIKLDAKSTKDGIPVDITSNADVRVRNVDVQDDQNGQRRITVVADAVGAPAHNIESGGPWLGVQFGPVPKALASHLQLEDGEGQMVLNVLEGSPADAAGFEKYDVITAIDGAKSSSDMGAFLDQIREFEPNDVATFSLIRGGSPTSATVTIGTRPDDMSAYNYKYPDDTAHVAHGNVFRRGGIMQKDNSGNWVFKDLGGPNGFNWNGALDLDDAHLNALLKNVPFGLQRDVTVQSMNGESVRIETDDDGKITVTKESTNGKDKTKSTATYNNEAEFERADPDAYAKYKSQSQNVLLHPMDMPHMLFLDKNDPNGMGLGADDLGNIQKRIEVLLDRVAPGGDLDATVRSKVGTAIRKMDKNGESMTADAIIVQNGKQTIFQVDNEGKITLTIRDGDNETVEAYDNLDQLKVARPDLADEFGGLLKSLTASKAEEK